MAGLLGERVGQFAQHLPDGCRVRARLVKRSLDLLNARLAKGLKNVFFGLEVIEKCTLTDIRGFGDILNRGGGDTPFGKEFEGCAHQTLVSFRAAAIAPAGFGERSREGRRRGRGSLSMTHRRI